MSPEFIKRAAQWIVGEDTGLSSISIWAHMMGVEPEDGFTSPSDPSDLGRCLRLLRSFPEWDQRISEMADCGHGWRAIAPHWRELEQLMADEVGIDWSKGNAAPRTWARMRALLNPVKA